MSLKFFATKDAGALAIRAKRLLRAIVAALIVLGAFDGLSRLHTGDFDLRYDYIPPVHIGDVLIVLACIACAGVFVWLSRGDGRHSSRVAVNVFLAVELVFSMIFFPMARNMIMFQLPLLGTPLSALIWWLVLMVVNAFVFVVGSGIQLDDLLSFRALLTQDLLGDFLELFAGGVFLYALSALLFAETEFSRQLREAQAQLARHARQEERHELTMELHDSLGHHLTALRMQLVLAVRQAREDSRERLAQSLSTVEHLLVELRSLVEARNEHPALPLSEQLQKLVGAIVRPRVSIDIDGRLPQLPIAVEKAIFRLCQEALTNAIRHSDAESLAIHMTISQDTLRIRIQDDGRGSDHLNWGNGLRGMSQRVERCGGRFTVESSVGAGVAITAEFSLERH